MTQPTCWLAPFSDKPCDGRLRVVHLVPKQTLKREGGDPWDVRSYVYACGGIMGLSGHHGELDGYQLTVPREALPEAVEALCAELGISWWLDRRFGHNGSCEPSRAG